MRQPDESIDCKLERLAVKRLQECNALGIAELKVMVRHRVAYIEGCVPSLHQSRRAEEVVKKGVEGLDGVVNKLRIACRAEASGYRLRKGIHRTLDAKLGIDEPGETPAIPISKQQIEGEILTCFADRLCIDSGVSVRFRDGVVDLLGEVSSQRLRHRAEVEAAWMPSVIRVENYLKVNDWPD